MTSRIIAEPVNIGRYVNGMAFPDVVATLLTIFHHPKKVLEFMTEVDLEVDSINMSRKGR